MNSQNNGQKKMNTQNNGQKKMNTQNNGQKKMNSQNNGQKKKEKKTNTTQKTKDRATRTQLTSGSELRCFVGKSSSCSTCRTHCVTYDMLSLKENNLLNFKNKVYDVQPWTDFSNARLIIKMSFSMPVMICRYSM